jgi:pimeloyl-ACP methyl ester carboxylesterase
MKLRRGDVEIEWDAIGSGPALLLLHAFPLDRRQWSETARSLSQRYRVLTIDARGFGDSKGGLPASLPDFADDAAAVLDASGTPMAGVCGLSMGGYVALAFADRHAARLSALVLADTRAGADSDEARRGRDQGIRTVREQGASTFVAPMPNRLLSARASDALREQVLALMRHQPADAIANALAAMRDRPDRTGELGRIDCPTLVLVGEADALTPPAEAEALSGCIKGAQLQVLPGAGHLSNLEAPEAFSSALAGFLDGAFPD